jgi:hypothetical protein
MDLRMSFHFDCFARTHPIAPSRHGEFLPEIIKFTLLSPQAAGRGEGGFLLECSVRSLMHAIPWPAAWAGCCGLPGSMNSG